MINKLGFSGTVRGQVPIENVPIKKFTTNTSGRTNLKGSHCKPGDIIQTPNKQHLIVLSRDANDKSAMTYDIKYESNGKDYPYEKLSEQELSKSICKLALNVVV